MGKNPPNDLAPELRPKYIVAIEERVNEVNENTDPVQNSIGVARSPESNLAVFSPTTPPEIITQAYLEIRAVETEEVVTLSN